jgi:hypothetical protein
MEHCRGAPIPGGKMAANAEAFEMLAGHVQVLANQL